MMNVAEKLAREIMRVTELRCQYEEVGRMPYVMQVPVYAVDLRKVAAEIEELRAALTGLVDIIESAGLLNLSNGVQLGQTSWYVKAVDRLAAAKAALSGIEGEDEQARGQGRSAPIYTDTKGTTK